MKISYILENDGDSGFFDCPHKVNGVEITVCRGTLRKHFRIPDHVNKVRITATDEDLVGYLPVRLIHNCVIISDPDGKDSLHGLGFLGIRMVLPKQWEKFYVNVEGVEQ